ncbi:MAG: hypothetical protein Q9194_006420, partial [Teloschistes cf. exilis]
AAADNKEEEYEANPGGVLQASKQLELVQRNIEDGWPRQYPEVKEDNEEKKDEWSETEVDDEK